jgi:hypothetical protein
MWLMFVMVVINSVAHWLACSALMLAPVKLD